MGEGSIWGVLQCWPLQQVFGYLHDFSTAQKDIFMWLLKTAQVQGQPYCFLAEWPLGGSGVPPLDGQPRELYKVIKVKP